MRNAIASTFIAAVLATFAGCQAQPPAAQDEATIRAATAHWIESYNAGDVEGIVSLYTDDAVVMPSNAVSIKGKEALREYLAKDIAAAKAAGITSRDGSGDVGISGDMAWHAGTGSAVDASGKVVGTNKYIEVWQRVDGKWLMVRDIWNDDPPPAPAPAPSPAK